MQAYPISTHQNDVSAFPTWCRSDVRDVCRNKHVIKAEQNKFKVAKMRS